VGKDATHTIGENTVVIDANERYLVPGLLDGHMHVESGMLTVTEFVSTIMPRGTTGIFIDPHEIGNVFGLEGVRLMADEAAVQPIHVFVQVPSCVPSAPGLETPGATLGPDEVSEALTWPGVIGLGEVMNFPGVVNGDEKMHKEIEATRRAGKIIGGHYASPDLGIPFHGYVAGGAQDDHEGTTVEDAIARARQGMRVMIREGSAWRDVAVLIRAVTELGLDSRNFILCTDDSHSQTLYYEGHMDRVVRTAISHGLSPMKAIQMATINTAEHFGVSREIGMIAPGRYADILIVNDLVEMDMELVIAKGQVVSKDGQLKITMPEINYPDWAINSVNLKRSLEVKDFRLVSRSDNNSASAHVIGVIEDQAPTQHLRMRLPVINGEVNADIMKDIAKIGIIERHHGSGNMKVGLVNGFGFDTPCAVASTVAHDCHHLIVVGTDDENMAIAANLLAECGGGQVVVKNGDVIGKVELPIAGLMANEPSQIVAKKVATVLEGFKACGSDLHNPNMQLSLMGLVVIPELRISDLGLVDVEKFEFIQVLEP
jgi:adenine deaminase